MQENRQPIRRNLTGGLSLGLFAGLWLALPEVVSVLLSGSGLRLPLGVAALHLTFGVLGGGVLGLFAGSWAALVSVIVQGDKHRKTLWRWFAFCGIALASVYPVSQLDYPTMIKVGALAGVLGAGFLVAPLLVDTYRRVYSGYTSTAFNVVTSLLLLACSSALSLWGVRLFPLPLYFEVLGLMFSMGAALLLFLTLRFRRRTGSRRGRGLAVLATPKPIVALLILAAAFGALGKHAVGECAGTDSARFAPIAFAMVSSQKAPAPAPHEPSTAYAGARFRIPPLKNLLILTQNGGELRTLSGAWRSDRLVIPSDREALVLASLFTGRNYGLRHHLAPHLPVSGPGLGTRLAAHRAPRLLVNLSGVEVTPAYLRELPSLGFPPPVPGLEHFADKARQLTASLSELSTPWVAWIHTRGDLPEGDFQNLMTRLRAASVWVLYIRWDFTAAQEVPYATLQLVGPKVTTPYPHPFPLTAVLPSLFGLGRKGFDLGGRTFPPKSRGIQWVRRGVPYRLHRGRPVSDLLPGLRRRAIRSMGDRLAPITWLSPGRSIQDQLVKMDQLLCRGWLNDSEKRKLALYDPKKPIHPQVDRRVGLLKALSARSPLPEWTKNMAVSELLKALNMDRDLFSLAEDGRDPVTVGWVIFYRSKGQLTKDLLNVCPGAGLAEPSITP